MWMAVADLVGGEIGERDMVDALVLVSTLFPFQCQWMQWSCILLEMITCAWDLLCSCIICD